VKGADFYSRWGKRAIDLVSSFFGLLILSPALLVLSALIKLSSPGTVFFRQVRIGKDGRPFWILKFRSMIQGADRMGKGITPGNDPRVTPLGVFLREWKLDELPQLWNVFKGDMSLVGPRPELPVYVAQYSAEQQKVLEVRPGITDPASLRYRDEGAILQRSTDPERLYREEILPDKLALNLQYLRDVSFSYDLSLIFYTIKSVVKHREVEERN